MYLAIFYNISGNKLVSGERVRWPRLFEVTLKSTCSFTSWKILNEVLNKRKSKLTYPSCFKINGEVISDTTSIATSFSKYFSNIGPNLAARISPSTTNFREFLSQTKRTPLEFQPLATDELKVIVHSFNSYKAPGVFQ